MLIGIDWGGTSRLGKGTSSTGLLRPGFANDQPLELT